MKYILVFGSLRKYSKRGYNYNRFIDYGEQIYIRDVILDNYEMYDLGYYPAVCEGKGKVKFELHSVTDETYTLISFMELNAGYSEHFVKLDGGVVASIFLMPKENLVKLKRVTDGDWN